MARNKKVAWRLHHQPGRTFSRIPNLSSQGLSRSGVANLLYFTTVETTARYIMNQARNSHQEFAKRLARRGHFGSLVVVHVAGEV